MFSILISTDMLGKIFLLIHADQAFLDHKRTMWLSADNSELLLFWKESKGRVLSGLILRHFKTLYFKMGFLTAI